MIMQKQQDISSSTIAVKWNQHYAIYVVFSSIRGGGRWGTSQNIVETYTFCKQKATHGNCLTLKKKKSTVVLL